MSLPALDNLVRIGQLKAEPRNATELARLLVRARRSLADAAVTDVSASTRFICAYSAGHAAALAALRWHGYRSENRFTVFQCLTHTLGWDDVRWRVLDAAPPKGTSFGAHRSAIWRNTRVFWRWKNPPSRNFQRWWSI